MMDNPEMMDAMEEKMEEAMEDEPMMEEEPAAEEPEKELTEIEKKLADGGFMCCCCLCECTEERTKDYTCCCFFPIKCGVLFIGVIILAITVFVFLEIFYELLNDDIHWWYVLVGVIIAATLVVASAFSVLFFTEDNDGSRVRLLTACMLVIIGVTLEAVWATVYFVFLYKKDSVTTGNDGVGFVKATRKQEVVITLYIACCIDALFAYFICVVNQYVDRKRLPKKGEEPMMMMEEEMDMEAMMEKPEEKMDDKPEEKPEEDKPADAEPPME